MDATHYIWSWVIYLLAAVGCLAVVWRLTRWGRPELRAVPRLLAAAILLTPMQPYPELSHWVPAFMVALMESINDGPAAAVPALRAIGFTALTALVISFAFFWYQARQARRAQDQAQNSA